MNYALIIGRLTADVDVRSKGKGADALKWVNFTVAVNRFGSETTDFINCTAWSKTAENLAAYCHKGSKVAVSGSLQQNIWEDENGKKHYETYINVQTVEFLDSKPKDEEEDSGRTKKPYNRNSR